jgi:hypothetical protein
MIRFADDSFPGTEMDRRNHPGDPDEPIDQNVQFYETYVTNSLRLVYILHKPK